MTDLNSIQRAEVIKKMEANFKPFPVPKELRARVSELVDRLNPVGLPDEILFSSPVFLTWHSDDCLRLANIAHGLEWVTTYLDEMFSPTDRNGRLLIPTLIALQYALEREIQRQMDFNELVGLIWKYDPGILEAVEEMRGQDRAAGVSHE